MARPKWQDITWQLHTSNNAHKPLFKDGGNNLFKLEPDNAVKPKFYTVKPVNASMANCWQDCILFELGHQEHSGEDVMDLLKNSPDSDYVRAGRLARSVFEGEEHKQARLVGDMAMVAGRLGVITLFQVSKKIGNQDPLLVLFVIDGTSPGGTAVGRPQ